MKIELRQYQEQALQAEAQHRIEHPEETRLAMTMATGLGKGMIIAARAVRHVEEGAEILPCSRVLILAHTDEIVSDLAARARLLADQSEFPITVGIVKAESDETAADIVVASTQTLLSPERRARITDVGLVIVDECELYAAPEWMGILRHFGCLPNYAAVPAIDGVVTTPALGFTATLRRGDGRGLGTLWQDVCFTRDISWGVRHGFLVQPIGHRLEIDPADIGFGQRSVVDRWTTAADTLDTQLMDCLAPSKIVEKWQELAADRRTIAFMPLVRSANALRNAFWAAHVRAETVHGDMPAELRRSYIARYKAGKIQVLVNAMVLTRGFDAPETDCVIIGRPTKSPNLGIQMAGRGLRPVPGVPVEEQNCILIYVSDATTDLFCHADLSDKPLDRTAQGALTVMEDQWDIGKALDEEEQARLWTGRVDVREFDPLAVRSSKVWKATKHGTPFLPIGTGGQYVFLVGTSVFLRTYAQTAQPGRFRTVRLHRNLPDLELAMAVAEDEAQERGGDLGRLLADRGRAWRKAVPSDGMKDYAVRLGLGRELEAILSARAGGKAGKLSDLISTVEATRALEPMVAKIKEATA